MLDPEPISERPWPRKFRDAFRGVKAGVRGQSSFFAHFFMTAAVIVAAVVLRVDLIEWCILLTCITMVLTAEMFNSALESMAKAVTGENDPHLGNSLDISSGAVLVASIGAAIVGGIIFVNRLGSTLQWW
jgi:diacylglycerol kinase